MGRKREEKYLHKSEIDSDSLVSSPVYANKEIKKIKDVSRRIAATKLEGIIEKKDHSQISSAKISEVTDLILQAGYTKPQIKKFLSEFTKAFSDLATRKPDVLSKAI